MFSIGKISKKSSALGEMSALLGIASTATAIALSPCTFAVVKDASAFVCDNHEVTLENVHRETHEPWHGESSIRSPPQVLGLPR